MVRGVCAVSSDKRPRGRHAPRALRRACGQGADLSRCMVRLGLGRFGKPFTRKIGHEIEGARQNNPPAPGSHGTLGAPLALKFQINGNKKPEPSEEGTLNKTEKRDYEYIKKDLSTIYKYPIYNIKKSTALNKLSKRKKSIQDVMDSDSLLRYSYKTIHQQFVDLIDFILKE